MSVPDNPYDPEVYELLVWFEVNGGVAKQDDIPERLRPWRAVLKRDGLLADTGTMHTVPTLSDFGRIALLNHRRQSTKPGYPKPADERLIYARKQLAEVEQYLAPESAVFASVLVRGLLGRN